MTSRRHCRTFERVDRRAFERLLEEARARGFTLSDAEGVFHYKGFDVQYRYASEACTLEICLLHKPALIPATVVWAMLDRIAARFAAGEFETEAERRSTVQTGESSRRRRREPRATRRPSPRDFRGT